MRPSPFPFPRGPLLPALVLLAGGALLNGCSDSETTQPAPRIADAQALYNYGIDALRDGRFKLASTQFEALQQNYPYSGYTASAELMEGYAYYLQGQYALSVQQLERYLQLHPTSPDAAYAFYLRALCFYEQIAPVARDQLGTAEALEALQEVVTRFPQSSYARDAQLKIDLCRDHLAGKEMMVGRFYQRMKDYQAALGRYQRVIQDFQTTNHVPEALERMVELDLDLGLFAEARQAGAVLGYNYPDSKWYRYAYARLKHHHIPVPRKHKKTSAQEKREKLELEKKASAKPGQRNSKLPMPSLETGPAAGARSQSPVSVKKPATPAQAAARPPIGIKPVEPITPERLEKEARAKQRSEGPITNFFGGVAKATSDAWDWFFDLAPQETGPRKMKVIKSPNFGKGS